MRIVMMALAVLASVQSVSAAEIILDFENLGLSVGDAIPATYGDTANSNVSYRELSGFGGTALVVDPTLSFWTNNFGDLTNVIWGTGVNDPSRVAEIRIEGLGGNVVRLNSFQAADWDGSANNQTFRVYDGQYNLLYEVAGVDVDDISHDTFFPAVSATTLNLQWDHGWAVALDNISLDVSSVPEPSSLFLAIPVGIGLLLRRNRQIVM